MDIIQDDVKRLDRLISDISDASRIDAELARGEMEIVDLEKLLLALVEVQQPAEAGQKGEVSGPSSRFARRLHRLYRPWYRGATVQVFQNLISNARSFTPPGEEISIVIARNRLQLSISIEDRGPGIPDKSLESIFERFYSERPESEF